MLETGILGERTITVTEELSAKNMKSGELMVYATPAMIALMEETAYKSVSEYLEEGQGTVGISMNVKHTAATPVGMQVTCKTQLTQVDGRRLVFQVSASDESGEIGTGIHERFIVTNESFQNKANSKLK